MQNDLRVRLRVRQDRDIKQGIELLGPLELGELSDLIRDGVRLKLKEKGVLVNGNGHFENPREYQEIY